MLTELERDRLLHRNEVDSRKRANNDTKVRQKFKDWLGSLVEAQLIFKHLPLDKIKKLISDDDAYSLFELSMYTMAARDFSPIIGEIEDAASWKTVVGKSDFNENITQTASNTDIVRSAYLTVLLGKLEYLLRSDRNPVAAIMRFKLAELNDSPEFSVFLKDNPDLVEKYRIGYERVCEAGLKLPTEKRKE